MNFFEIKSQGASYNPHKAVGISMQLVVAHHIRKNGFKKWEFMAVSGPLWGIGVPPNWDQRLQLGPQLDET
jgi:hypothetical protein